MTGADVGEGFSRFPFKQGDLVMGDRFYAKSPGLQHVLRSGADFLVRVGWNSMRMVTADGARLNLASIYARMAPGETSEVAVFVTGRNKGQGREPRQLFPARLIIFRQHEEASARAVRAAKRQHSKKRSGMVLQAMTLASARFLMVLTSLPADRVTASAALAAYRLRWQVELAFKRLKSGLGIDRLRARDPVMARSWLLSHLILALLIEDGAGEVLDSPPVLHAGHTHPVSMWRLHAVLKFTLLGAVLSSLRMAGLGQVAGFVTRHICDPPRQRSCQSALARSCTPFPPSPLHG